MKPKQAILRVLCKLGFHSSRVTGHANAKEGTEYYYSCAFCDDGFWDYAMPNHVILRVEEAIGKGDYSQFVPVGDIE